MCTLTVVVGICLNGVHARYPDEQGFRAMDAVMRCETVLTPL